MPRPIVAIAMQSLPALPGEWPPAWVIGQKYVQVLRSRGAVPLLVPLMPDDPDLLTDLCDRADAVFLTGGVDVDPSRYGEHRHPLCGETDPARDTVELQLLAFARERGLPVLAICRGIQILNVAFGGTLYQDVSAQLPAAIKHDHFPTADRPSRSVLAHEIRVEPKSHLATVLGAGPVPVNSMHHQAIKDLAPALRPTALAPDGVIEGVESTDGRFLVGVQWHPEELTDINPGMCRLFQAFLAAAA